MTSLTKSAVPDGLVTPQSHKNPKIDKSSIELDLSG